MNSFNPADMFSNHSKQMRKDTLKLIAEQYRIALTNDTVAVLLQVMGMLPLNNQPKEKCFAYIQDIGISGISDTLAFQLSTFFNEDLPFTLSTLNEPMDDYAILKHMVEKFNHRIDYDQAQKMTVPCYLPAIKVQLHYEMLIDFTPHKAELVEALEIKVWHQYIYEPKNYSQTCFVRLMFGKYFKFWNMIKYNLRNLDPDCSNITEMLNLVGITKRILINDHLPGTELSVNQLIPIMRWDERWLEHGVCSLKVRAIVNYFSDKVVKTRAQKIDISVWLSRFPKWLNDHTYFDLDVGDVGKPQIAKVRIHNHNVIDYLSLPKYNGKVNLKKHPSEWLLENVSDGLLRLIRNTHKFLNTTFPLKQQYIHRINTHYPNQEVAYLDSAQALIDEGDRMSNCVGGFRYVDGAVKGDYHFYHLSGSVVDCHGLTVQVCAKRSMMANLGGMIQEVKGYDNRELNDEECAVIAKFVSDVYFPDLTIGEVKQFLDYHK